MKHFFTFGVGRCWRAVFVPYIHYYIYYNSYYIISLACVGFAGVVLAYLWPCGVLYAFGLCIALNRLCGRCAVWTLALLALCASCAVGRWALGVAMYMAQRWTLCRVPCVGLACCVAGVSFYTMQTTMKQYAKYTFIFRFDFYLCLLCKIYATFFFTF